MTVNRLPYSDPLRAGRHPFQTYLLALCVVSGAPMAAGQVTANSLEEQLPEPLVIAWGVMLVFGAVVALFGFGVACTRRARDIGHIFQRALATNPAGVKTEFER